MSKLLINDKPLVILPSLAVRIGLHEAVVLQQIHYWLCSSHHEIEGRKWVYNTYENWQKQLPFWSVSTVKRMILSLENLGLLITANWNASKLDKTKWYSIDYTELKKLVIAGPESSAAESEPSEVSELVEEDSLNEAIPEITSEITKESNIIPFTVLQSLIKKMNKSFKL
jgi:hypothetical protein